MVRDIDGVLDAWRGLFKETRAIPENFDNALKRLTSLGVPPDLAAKWLLAKRPVSTRRRDLVADSVVMPKQAMHP